MNEFFGRLLRERGRGRNMILFLFLMLTAGITVTALLAGKTIRLEEEASDLSRAVLIAASGADIYYVSENTETFSEIMTEEWNFTELPSEDGALLFEDPDGFRLRLSVSPGEETETAGLTILRNGREIYTLQLEKAAVITGGSCLWNGIFTA